MTWDRLTQPLDDAITTCLSSAGFDLVTQDPTNASFPLINKPSEPFLLTSAYLLTVVLW
jgi:hypothetical protein